VIVRVIFFTNDPQFQVGSDSQLGSGGFLYICQNAVFGRDDGFEQKNCTRFLPEICLKTPQI
jgi:hypothetical protein